MKKNSNKIIYKNKSNKKGFTLIEILVGLTCSLLVIGTITGSLMYVSKLNTQLLNKSSNLYKIRNIKNYILSNYEDGDMVNVDTNDDGKVTYTKKDGTQNIIAVNTSITYIHIDDNKPKTDDNNNEDSTGSEDSENTENSDDTEETKNSDDYAYTIEVTDELTGETTTVTKYLATCIIKYNENSDKIYKFLIKEKN